MELSSENSDNPDRQMTPQDKVNALLSAQVTNSHRVIFENFIPFLDLLDERHTTLNFLS